MELVTELLKKLYEMINVIIACILVIPISKTASEVDKQKTMKYTSFISAVLVFKVLLVQNLLL